ncbi:MAG: alginate export family protein, partial [Mariprofundaceae bacterium]|nr:alginate export family protein [Mariprofundaceae bacterium]
MNALRSSFSILRTTARHSLILLAIWLLTAFTADMGRARAAASAAEHITGPELAFFGMSIKAGGNLRMRYERKDGFGLGSAGAVDPQDYLLSRLRVHLQINAAQFWNIYLEGQDSRVHSAFSENTVNDTKAANIFADRFDLHQAYLDLLPGEQTRIRLGRQKLNLGALRLVASLEWVNTARVLDAVRLTQTLGEQGRTLDMFASRLVPVRPRSVNTHALTGNRLFDSQFHGIYFTDAHVLGVG